MDRNDQFVTKHPTIGSETLMSMRRLRGVRVKLFALLTRGRGFYAGLLQS